MLVNVAKGVETGVKKFNKFDDKVTKTTMKKVVKPAVKNVKKAAKKVGMAALRGTAGAVGGAIKGAGQGAMKGIKKGLREEDMMKPEMDTKPKSKKEKKEEDDPRSMPTKINLAKNKMRAMGLNMQYDHGSGLVDAYKQVHDQLDEKNKGDQELRKKAKGYDSFIEKRPISKKEQGTRAVIGRRNTTGAMNRGGLGYAKPERETTERRERHKADRGVKTKGTKSGHSGSAYPKKSSTMDTMYPHKKKHRLSMMAKDKKIGIKRPGGRAK